MPMKLLIIEDDPAMLSTLQRTFVRRGVDVSACADGAQAVAQWLSFLPDVVVLDLTLPGMDGLDIIRSVRAHGLTTPTLILTARGTVGDRILGLNMGADDYLPKPFDLDELEARINALGRRTQDTTRAAVSPHTTSLVQFANLQWDSEQGTVYCLGLPMEMPPRELAMLQALIQHRGQALARERLFARVFAHDPAIQSDALDVVAYRLRKRLHGTGVQLVTLRGLGFLLKTAT
jgi:two-component system, OmpR family, response regulator TctD